MEILDLIAKVSWETNEAALAGVGKEMHKQDKLLDDLREKGKRLNDQIIKTNDPKKVKALNDELQKTFKQVTSITEAQKKQATATEQLKKKQMELVKELQKTSDPKLVQGLLRNLAAVENKLTGLTKTASSLPSKIGGIGSSLLQGFGLGAGMFGLQAATSAISSFVSGAIDEATDAQRTAIELERTLKTIGKGKYFDGLVKEADTLAVSFKGVFDNDDIIKAQSALISYGKVTRNELSQLLPVIMELASAENIDLAQATDKVIGIMEGRGGATLRQYGLSVKDLKTEHGRLNLVLGEFANKLKGSTDAFAESAEGQRRILETSIANAKEQLGNRLLPIWSRFLNGLNNSFDILGNAVDRVNRFFTPDSINRMNDHTANLKKLSEGVLAGANAGGIESNKALNPNATELDPEAIAAAKEAEKRRKEEAKRRQDEAKKLAEENAKLQKSIQEGAKKNQIANEKDLSERPDVTNALAQIKANEDRLVQIERENLSEPLIEAAANAAKRRAKAEVDAENKVKKEAAQERRLAEMQELASSYSYFASEINQIISLEEQRTARQIELQQQRVDAAKTSSEAGLKIEQNRLDELVRKRERYERAQRAIDATVIVANQAVAISGAVRTIASGGNPILIAANVLAILAGIAASVGAIRSINADAGFREGGYTGDGDPSQTSTALGNRGYKYHKKEFVMNEELTNENRDMFEQMHRGNLVAKRIGQGYYLMPPSLDTDKAISDHYTVRQQLNTASMEGILMSIDRRLQSREVVVNNNLDADGFSTKVASQLGQLSILNKLRNS